MGCSTITLFYILNNSNIQSCLDARQQSFPAGFPRTVAIYQADVRITVGEDFTFIVNVTGNPPPKITWFKDNRFMDWSNPRITLLANKSLHLARAEESDSGKYDYMAENDKGRIFSRPWFFSAKSK